jgi:hypothetical protein
MRRNDPETIMNDSILNDERFAHTLHEDDDTNGNWSHKDKDETAKKWPAGYWERYESLRAEARTICGYPNANVVALMNGYFEVRYKNIKGVDVSGPQKSERADALIAFIEMHKAS